MNDSTADIGLKMVIRDKEFRLRYTNKYYSIEIDLISQFGKLQSWSPETPVLYDFQVHAETDTV